LKHYQKWWSKSSFSNPVYYDCYLISQDWSNEDMLEFIHPFRQGYGAMSFIRAYLTKPDQRKMILAYYRSFSLGW